MATQQHGSESGSSITYKWFSTLTIEDAGSWFYAFEAHKFLDATASYFGSDVDSWWKGGLPKQNNVYVINGLDPLPIHNMPLSELRIYREEARHFLRRSMPNIDIADDSASCYDEHIGSSSAVDVSTHLQVQLDHNMQSMDVDGSDDSESCSDEYIGSSTHKQAHFDKNIQSMDKDDGVVDDTTAVAVKLEHLTLGKPQGRHVSGQNERREQQNAYHPRRRVRENQTTWHSAHTTRMMVPAVVCGSIIGRGGTIIKSLQEDTGTKICLLTKEEVYGQTPVIIKGSHEQRREAEYWIGQIVDRETAKRGMTVFPQQTTAETSKEEEW